MHVHNGTDHAIGLHKISLEIQSSKIVTDCLPVFDDMSPGNLRITNQGWARIELPRLRFSIQGNDDEGSPTPVEIPPMPLATIADSKVISLADYMPAHLRKHLIVRVAGTMQYGEPDDRRSVTFSTHVRNDRQVNEALTKTNVFNASFRAGQVAPIDIELESGPELKPGETATFPIRVRTDKTCLTRLSIDFMTTDRQRFMASLFCLRCSCRDSRIRIRTGTKSPLNGNHFQPEPDPDECDLSAHPVPTRRGKKPWPFTFDANAARSFRQAMKTPAAERDARFAGVRWLSPSPSLSSSTNSTPRRNLARPS